MSEEKIAARHPMLNRPFSVTAVYDADDDGCVTLEVTAHRRVTEVLVRLAKKAHSEGCVLEFSHTPLDYAQAAFFVPSVSRNLAGVGPEVQMAAMKALAHHAEHLLNGWQRYLEAKIGSVPEKLCRHLVNDDYYHHQLSLKISAPDCDELQQLVGEYNWELVEEKEFAEEIVREITQCYGEI